MMEFYKFLVGCIFISTLSTVVAIQCHQCMYGNSTSSFSSFVQGDPRCKDPFQATGIEVVECAGQCYANVTKVSFGDPEVGYSHFEQVFRGCAVDAGTECGFFQGCQEAQGSLACLYCCEENNCNAQDIKAFDQNIFKCFTCSAPLDANGMPVDDNTCGRADFDGTKDDINVVKYPCPSETCLTFIAHALPAEGSDDGPESAITRTCAIEELIDLCENTGFYETFGGYEIDCCSNGSLCNVGRRSFEPPVTKEPRPVIDCYVCSANLTVDGLPVDQSSCGRADFDGSGQDVLLLPCETGICLTMFTPTNEHNPTSFITRMCVPAEFIGACDNPSFLTFIFGFEVNLECCIENRCNVGGAVITETDSTTERVVVIGTSQPGDFVTSASGDGKPQGENGDGNQKGENGDGTQNGEDGNQKGGDGGGAAMCSAVFIIYSAFLFAYGLI